MALAYDLPADVIRERIWQTSLPTAFDEGRLTTREWYEAVSARLDRTIDADTFDNLILSAFAPDPAVIEVVRAIRGPRIAALTSNSSQFAAALPTHLPDLAGLFAPILCSYELGARKPHPAAYHGALARLGVAAEQVLFIDDQHANVDAARAIGMHAEQFTDARMLRRVLERADAIPRPS